MHFVDFLFIFLPERGKSHNAFTACLTFSLWCSMKPWKLKGCCILMESANPLLYMVRWCPLPQGHLSVKAFIHQQREQEHWMHEQTDWAMPWRESFCGRWLWILTIVIIRESAFTLKQTCKAFPQKSMWRTMIRVWVWNTVPNVISSFLFPSHFLTLVGWHHRTLSFKSTLSMLR